MGVTHQTTAIYECDQCGLVAEAGGAADPMAGVPEGWMSMGNLWFHQWACLRDYAAAQVGTA